MTAFADAAFGQALSIIRKGETEISVEATAPSDSRYVLQASRNLHLWADIEDQVFGQSSHRVDTAGDTALFFRLTQGTDPAPPIRLVLLGDSTVAGENDWGSGWGKGMHGYFKPEVQIINLAWPNTSTKVFLASEQMPKMLAIKPDVVLLQYGWIDAGGCDGDLRCATSLQEFADNLKTIVAAIRGFDGTPILVTQPEPNVFDANGKLVPNVALRERSVVMKSVAAELQTHLIDLNQMTADLLNALGKSGSDYISASPADRVHYSLAGAKVISGLIVNALPDNLGTYLVGIFNPPPAP
jgi:hypothetical protein